MTDITKEFIKKVKEVYDDEEYMIGMLSIANTDEDRKKAIDFINSYDNVDDEKLAVFLIMNKNKRH